MAEIVISIFKTDQNEDRLRKIIKESDNTFAPMGSSGYGIQEDEEGFFATQMDCSPATKYKIGVYGRNIWVYSKFGYFIANILIDNGVVFSVAHCCFKSKIEVRQSFSRVRCAFYEKAGC
jgi:hypothetical protein